MVIKKIALIPAYPCNSKIEHFDDNDPVKLWTWDGYYPKTHPKPYHKDYYFDEDDPFNFRDFPQDNSTYLREDSEITILTGTSKEVFSLIEIFNSDYGKSSPEFEIRYFGRNIVYEYSIKELKNFKEILELSINFTKETMSDLIYNSTFHVQDENSIKITLEKYLSYINEVIDEREKDVQDLLGEYDLL